MLLIKATSLGFSLSGVSKGDPCVMHINFRFYVIVIFTQLMERMSLDKRWTHQDESPLHHTFLDCGRKPEKKPQEGAS